MSKERKFRTREAAEELARFYPGAYIGEGHADRQGPYFTIEKPHGLVLRENGQFQ